MGRRRARRYRRGVAAGLVIMDEDGKEVVLDARESECLFVLTGGLEAATVSACPDCRCRVLAGMALVDLLDAAPPHPRGVVLSHKG